MDNYGGRANIATMFKIARKSHKSAARLGVLSTLHGSIKTPFFMPIASKAAVKTLDMGEMRELGASIILANTYHLMLRPGLKIIKQAGGLHHFINWLGPILTDSGGFQVFSLSNLRQISEKGVIFNDPETGNKYELTPELSIKIQKDLGVDIMMVLDECTPYPCDYNYARESMEMTTRWASRCQKSKSRGAVPVGRQAKFCASAKFKKQLLFGIVQGSVYRDLRLKSIDDLVKLNFDGYAIGGLALGEGTKKMFEVLEYSTPALPENKPRYLMGVGRPEEIIGSVQRGVDMFDCVIPTREGRHGKLFIRNKRINLKSKNFYKTINISNSQFATDYQPINQNSKFSELRNLSKAYLNHLFRVKEPLAQKLASLNNLEFYLDLMEEIRESIKRGEL